jgi:hypothetical protein
MTRRFVVAVALTVVSAPLWLAGCARGTTGAPTGGGPMSTATPSSSGAPSARPTSSIRLTVPPTPTKGATSGLVTLRGQVTEGVEAGCVILTSDVGTVYDLIATDRGQLVTGSRMEVVGEPVPGLVTTCQQGIPFKVHSARGI